MTQDIKFEYSRNVDLPEQVLCVAYKTEVREKNGKMYTLLGFGFSVNKISKERNKFGRLVFVGDQFQKSVARKLSSQRLMELSNFQIAFPWADLDQREFEKEDAKGKQRMTDWYFRKAMDVALVLIAFPGDEFTDEDIAAAVHPDVKIADIPSASEIALQHLGF
jgi:hypothetical protein